MEFGKIYTLKNQAGGEIRGRLFMHEEHGGVKQFWATEGTPMRHGWNSELYYYLEEITDREKYKYGQPAEMLAKCTSDREGWLESVLPTNYIVLLRQKSDPPNTYVLRTGAGVMPYGSAERGSRTSFGNNYDTRICTEHPASAEPELDTETGGRMAAARQKVAGFLSGDSTDGTDSSSGSSSLSSGRGGGKRKKSKKRKPKKRKSKRKSNKTRKRRY